MKGAHDAQGSAPAAALLHSQQSGEVIGEGAGMAKINQQAHLLRTQAEQV